MKRPLEQIPVQLYQYLLPGLEMAAQEVIDRMNSVCIALGWEPRYGLSVGGAVLPSYDAMQTQNGSGGKRRRWSPESRARMSEIQRKVWAKKRAAGEVEVKPKSKRKSKSKQASIDQLLGWAKAHKSLLDLRLFKEKYPKLELKPVGTMVSNGLLKRIEPKVYELTEKAKGE